MNNLEELTPDHTVAIGDDVSEKNGFGSGIEGEHEDIVVTITDADGEHTFSTDATIETDRQGDYVKLKDVPSHIGVELLGCIVELEGESVASGDYTWLEQSRKQDCKTERVIDLLQIVACASCGQSSNGNAQETPLGLVCERCGWEIDNPDNEEGDQ